MENKILCTKINVHVVNLNIIG